MGEERVMEKILIYDSQFRVPRIGEWAHHGTELETETGKLWKETMKFMSSIGFYVGEDKRIKRDYPILNNKHRYGRYSDLEFKSNVYLNGFEIEFFQNINFENPCGGEYDFKKLEKMPYLVRKQYELTEKKLAYFFKKHELVVEYQQNLKKGREFVIEEYIRSCHKPQKEWFPLKEIDGETAEYERNATDRDGNIIYNGETKYFRDYSGYLNRGQVYYDINMNWWAVLPDGRVTIHPCWEYFDLNITDKRGRNKQHRPPEKYIERKKQLAECSVKELEQELKRRRKLV